MEHPLVLALAAEAKPDMVLPETLYTADYDTLKRRFDRAMTLAAREADVFHGCFYWMTLKGTPQYPLEVRSWAKATADLLARWSSPSVQGKVEATLRQMRLAHSNAAPLNPDAAKAAIEAADAFLRRWLPLAEKLIAAKARVIKGRKPSATPRKTDPRTIENTGTCACCGQNVKLHLNAKKIVMHGFTIRPGWRAGRCFGVGYSPIETGKDGLEAYLIVLQNHRDSMQRSVDSFKGRDPNETLQRTKYQRHGTVRSALAAAESNLRYVLSDIKEVERRIREWKPRPLPT